MEYVDGRIFKDPTLPELSTEERRQIYDAAIQVLASIHRVNIKEAGLEQFGKAGKTGDQKQLCTWKTCAVLAMEMAMEIVLVQRVIAVWNAMDVIQRKAYTHGNSTSLSSSYDSKFVRISISQVTQELIHIRWSSSTSDGSSQTPIPSSLSICSRAS